MKLGLLGAIALAGACCVPSYASSFSGTSIPIPSGLVSGDTFQFVFVTYEAYIGISGTIGTYNADVSTSANETLSLVNGLGITWSALVSTPSENVLNNIADTSPSTPGFAGIYDLGGNLIADGTETTGEGLYSGSIQHPLDIDEYGGASSENIAWTGTDSNGTTSSDSLGRSVPLVGLNTSTSSWTEDTTKSKEDFIPLYAISNVLTLGSGDQIELGPVPEPATVWITLFGLAACYLAAKRKRIASSASTLRPIRS